MKSSEGEPEVPGVVAHTYGRGRVVYFAGGFDSAYYLYAYPYQRLLIKNAIDWAAVGTRADHRRAHRCAFISR